MQHQTPTTQITNKPTININSLLSKLKYSLNSNPINKSTTITNHPSYKLIKYLHNLPSNLFTLTQLQTLNKLSPQYTNQLNITLLQHKSTKQPSNPKPTTPSTPSTITTTITKLTLFPGSKITSKWSKEMVGITTPKGKFIAHLYQLPHFTKLLNSKDTVTITLKPCYYHKSLQLAS